MSNIKQIMGCQNLLFLVCAMAIACTDDTDAAPSEEGIGPSTGTMGDPGSTTSATGGDSTGSDTSSDTSSDSMTGLCDAVLCESALTLDLSFQQKVSNAIVGSELSGVDWISSVDASAGGVSQAPNNPWVYLQFSEQGLQKVEIDDFAALTSADWDIAAKRFGIRVNSGSSGAGCVEVASVAGAYEDISVLPSEAVFARELFYDQQCNLIEDGSGLAGSPDYLMAGWWSYVSCVMTTGQTYIVQLADHRSLKLVVDSYYQMGQMECNEQGTMGTGSAQMRWRWRFLE